MVGARYDQTMGDYPWFCKTIRQAVAQNASIATALRAVLEGRKPRVDEEIFASIESRDALDEAIENGLQLAVTKEGRRELRKLIHQHRYNAGFRTDDIALRHAFRQWQDESKERVDLLRVTPDQRRA